MQVHTYIHIDNTIYVINYVELFITCLDINILESMSL